MPLLEDKVRVLMEKLDIVPKTDTGARCSNPTTTSTVTAATPTKGDESDFSLK